MEASDTDSGAIATSDVSVPLLFYKIRQNDLNQGLAYTLNKLIEILENEEYVLRMDSDDICKLDRVRKQVAFMELNKEVEIIGGAIEEINNNGKIKMIRTYPKTTEEAKKFIPKASVLPILPFVFENLFLIKDFVTMTNIDLVRIWHFGMMLYRTELK